MKTLGPDPSYSNGWLVVLFVLPALSVQLPVRVALGALGPEYVGCGQEKMPEKELPLTEAVTGAMYQPLLGGRGRLIETVGLDASYWKAALISLTVFPALSVQVPVTVADFESVPEYVVEVQAAILEKDCPLTVVLTGFVYQLPLFGETLLGEGRVMEVIVGVEASYWKAGLSIRLVSPALSVQLPGTVAPVLSGPE
jgi:hypothetical protein